MSAIRRLLRYIWRVLLFLTVGSSTFWITLVPLILAGVCVLIWACSEPALRWIGLVLQLAGFVTVAWGIDSRRKVFGLPNLTGSLREWWERRPRFREKLVAIAAHGTMKISGGPLRVTLSASLDADVAARVEVLEKNYRALYKEVGTLAAAHKQAQDHLQQALESERNERAKEIAALETRTRQAVAHGYRIEWAGVLYFLFGIILASGSFELANWLTRFC